MPSNHLFLCHPLLLLPSIFPCARVFSSESALLIKWPNYWSFSFSISPSNEYSGFISFRTAGLISLLSNGLLRVFSSTTVQKNQSTISIHLSPFSWTSRPLPPSHPSRSSQNTKLPVLYRRFLPAILHMLVCICQSQSPNSSHSPIPQLCPQIHSLCLHFYSCLGNRFICIIFIDSTYMH